MRHRRRGGKLGRPSGHRLALVRNLVTALLEHERVETTHAKARELRRVADRMITLGKRGNLHARRRALRVIRSADVAAKVFGDLAERFRDRPGGYTRVVRLRDRAGDAAPLSLVELVDRADTGKAAAEEKAGRKAGTKPEKGKREKARAAKPRGEKPQESKTRKRGSEAAAKRGGAVRKPEGAKPRGGRRSTSD